MSSEDLSPASKKRKLSDEDAAADSIEPPSVAASEETSGDVSSSLVPGSAATETVDGVDPTAKSAGPLEKEVIYKQWIKNMFTAEDYDGDSSDGSAISYLNCRLDRTLAQPDLVAGAHFDVISVNLANQVIEFRRYLDSEEAGDEIITMSYQVVLDRSTITKRNTSDAE